MVKTSVNPKIIYLGKSRLHRNRANVIQTVQMVQAFQNVGATVQLFLPPWKNQDLRQRLTELGVSTDLDVRSSFLLHSTLFPYGVRTFIFLKKKMLLKSDIVFVRSLDMSLNLGKMRVPHVLEVHEKYELENHIEKKKIWQTLKSNRVLKIIAISQEVGNAIVCKGIDAKKIVVAHSGYNKKNFSKIPPLNSKNLEFPTIIYIGRISKDRGLKVLNFLAKKSLGKIQLFGILDNTPSLHANIQYGGNVPHETVPKCYENADVVVMPYQKNLRHADSISPIKLFEAMAAGRPIIASDLPSIREIIEHMKNGLLVPPDQPEKWVEALQLLKSDPALACRLARNARIAAESFNWDQRARLILNEVVSTRNLNN